jgi:hypothetical protein
MELTGGDLSKDALRKAITGPVSRSSFNAVIYDQLKLYKSTSSNNPQAAPGKAVGAAAPPPQQQQQQQQQKGGVENMALSVDDLKLRSYAGGAVDPADKLKLAVLVKYIDGVVREINSKSNLIRSALSSGATRDLAAASSGPSATTGNVMTTATGRMLQESDIDLVSINMFECVEDSLFVPHQKGDGRFFASFSSEQSRRALINNPAAVRSLKKLRACYGLYSQETAKRALTSGIVPEPILDTDSSDGPSKAASSLQRKPNGLGKQNDMTTDAGTDDNSADAQTLVRRIKALSLPPLPPDVGSLSSPEERRL